MCSQRSEKPRSETLLIIYLLQGVAVMALEVWSIALSLWHYVVWYSLEQGTWQCVLQMDGSMLETLVFRMMAWPSFLGQCPATC